MYSLVQDYGIKGFPTIKVFVPGKPPVDYNGERDAKSIATFAYKQVCYTCSWMILKIQEILIRSHDWVHDTTSYIIS